MGIADEFDIYKIYLEYMSETGSRYSPGLAAVSALTRAVAHHRLQTLSETLTLLSTLSDDLKQQVSPPEAISAAADLFQRQLSTNFARSHAESASTDPIQDESGEAFNATKTAVINAGNTFVDDGLKARERIANYAPKFLRDGCTVIVLGCSPLEDLFLRHGVSSGNDFRVIFVSFTETPKEDLKRRTSLTELLEREELPNMIVPTERLASILSNDTFGSNASRNLNVTRFTLSSTFVLAEPSAMYSNGSILAPLGTHTAACVAKALERPFWAISEIYNILSWFPSPKSNSMMDDSNLSSLKSASSSMDVTPSTLIRGIITEYGPQNTTAVSEEAIRVWF